MIECTTPTYSWTLPFSTDFIKDCYVTYVQGKTKLVKETEDCVLDRNIVLSRLTSEESSMFYYGQGLLEVQLVMLLHNGEIVGTPVSKVSIDRMLDRRIFKL